MVKNQKRTLRQQKIATIKLPKGEGEGGEGGKETWNQNVTDKTFKKFNNKVQLTGADSKLQHSWVRGQNICHQTT